MASTLDLNEVIKLITEQAVELLEKSGVHAGILHINTIKPLDVDRVRRCARSARVVVCVEEHRQIGGLSSAVLHALATADPPVLPGRFVSVGVDDLFPAGYGSYEELMAHYGMTGGALAERARTALAQSRSSASLSYSCVPCE